MTWAVITSLLAAAPVGCDDRSPEPAAEVAPAPSRAMSDRAPANAPAPGPEPAAQAAWFTEITSEVGLEMIHDARIQGEYFMPEIMGAGCALLDFDGDGRLDIYLVDGGLDRLLRQSADGTFADVTEAAGIRATGFGMGCAVGDYDNDGDPDLYVTNFGPDELWMNNGDGTFTDVTAAAGVANDLWAVSAAFVDYDRDGRLDLYVINYLLDPGAATCFDPAGRPDYCGPQNFHPAPDRLYHNEGGGRFRDVSAEAGIAAVTGPGLGVVCADFNGDRWADMYVANDAEPSFLWLNRRDGTFEEVAQMLGCAVNRDGQPEAGMGIALGDVDGDGRNDLFVTHLVNETNTLYRAESAGFFIDATSTSGLGPSSYPYTGFGTGFADFDHDGDLDLLVVNGAVKRRNRAAANVDATEYWRLYAEPNLFYLNDGRGRFTEAGQQAGPMCTRAEVSRGLAFGDIDDDGDIDVLKTNDGGPARLFRNDMPKRGRWLIVRVIDPALGRDALGAEVTVEAGGRTQSRTVVAAYSYGSSSEPIAHFGLGGADHVDGVFVRWPDGTDERFTGVSVDAAVVLRRGSGAETGR